jgi:hypothetical protein
LFSSPCAFGVGHPVEPLPDMGRAEARSAGICRPEGVARRFQVSRYKVEPSEAVFRCNLLAKDEFRTALFDEPMERGPKVPLISKPAAFACRAERLAGTGAGPDRSIVGPSGLSQGEAPDADASEEVALNKSGKVGRSDIFDAPFVDLAMRNEAIGDQFAQPRRRERVVLVVVGPHPHRQQSSRSRCSFARSSASRSWRSRPSGHGSESA